MPCRQPAARPSGVRRILPLTHITGACRTEHARGPSSRSCAVAHSSTQGDIVYPHTRGWGMVNARIAAAECAAAFRRIAVVHRRRLRTPAVVRWVTQPGRGARACSQNACESGPSITVSPVTNGPCRRASPGRLRSSPGALHASDWSTLRGEAREVEQLATSHDEVSERQQRCDRPPLAHHDLQQQPSR